MARTYLEAKIPSLAELCCLVVQIDETEIKDSSAKSHFHWKTMKCRMIINDLQHHVIASPVYETPTSIHVITSVDFYNGGTLQNSLREMNLKLSATCPATPDVYAKCLRYSIKFAIAPRWNGVGQYLMRDQNFLTFPDTFAIKFGLTVQAGQEKHAQSLMTVQPIKLHMIDVKLENLKIPSEIIAQFMADPKGVIDLAYLGTFRVTVLPSLKKGRLMTVLKCIPASSPFKDYKELRRHWKNMYGYRLPQNDDNLIYYEILFPVPMIGCYLYPEICVKTDVYERSYLGDSEMVIRSFARDLSETVSRVCGLIFEITRDGNPFENSSTVNFSPSAQQTSEDTSKVPENRGNFVTSARLSLFPTGNRTCSQTSTLMSPTPSIRGSARAHRGNFRPRHILAKLEKIAGSKYRVTDRSREGQNLCPNSDDPIGRNVPQNPGKTKKLAGLSGSNDSFRTPNNPVIHYDAFSTESSEDDSSSNSRRSAKIKTKISTETRSKYFAANEDNRSHENLVTRRASTLSQKLKHNLSSLKKSDDQ